MVSLSTREARKRATRKLLPLSCRYCMSRCNRSNPKWLAETIFAGGDPGRENDMVLFNVPDVKGDERAAPGTFVAQLDQHLLPKSHRGSAYAARGWRDQRNGRRDT